VSVDTSSVPADEDDAREVSFACSQGHAAPFVETVDEYGSVEPEMESKNVPSIDQSQGARENADNETEDSLVSSVNQPHGADDSFRLWLPTKSMQYRTPTACFLWLPKPFSRKQYHSL
jgi:hypothetical protein